MTIHCYRLNPNDDLKKKLADICLEKNIQAGCILSSVGSLKVLNLRLAKSKTFLEQTENFEILSLNGTISVHGLHVHASVSNSEGTVFGGHLMDGNIIYTTCELVILELTDYNFRRNLDAATGFKELHISKK
jgi:predicted DNA-binding protein with PD1-like motif